MKKPSNTKHVEPRMLFDAAEGAIELKPAQRRHLHQCERCQFVFEVFVKREIDNPRGKKQSTKGAA